MAPVPHRERDPPHPVDLVKSPQMSAVAVAAGLGCGQDTVAPPIDVPKSEGKGEKRRRQRSQRPPRLVVSVTPKSDSRFQVAERDIHRETCFGATKHLQAATFPLSSYEPLRGSWRQSRRPHTRWRGGVPARASHTPSPVPEADLVSTVYVGNLFKIYCLLP